MAVGSVADDGLAAVFEHVQTYLDRLEEGLLGRGFRSRRTPFAAGRSGILGVEAPDGVVLSEVHGGLLDAGVATTMPDGVLRFAPHWPNALDEVEAVLAPQAAAVAPLSLGKSTPCW